MKRGPIEVTVVFLEGGFASESIGPAEVFYSAGVLWNQLHGRPAEPRFRVRTASVSGREVQGLCGLRLKPEFGIDEVRATDVIIVPASGLDAAERMSANPGLVPWIRKWHRRGAAVAGICTGVGFLAEAGILDGRRATTHWAVAEAYRRKYPQVLWEPDQFVTEDRGAFCGGGVYAALDLSLYLVEKFCGREIALECARSLLIGMPRNLQSGYAVTPLSRPHEDEQIRRAEAYMQQHFAGSVSIADVAQRIGMSTRNFIRRFKGATGRLPGAYLQALRIASAREMLERGSAAIERVAAKSGYDDAAFFRSLFKRHTGFTPAEYRTRFGKTTAQPAR